MTMAPNLQSTVDAALIKAHPRVRLIGCDDMRGAKLLADADIKMQIIGLRKLQGWRDALDAEGRRRDRVLQAVR